MNISNQPVLTTHTDPASVTFQADPASAFYQTNPASAFYQTNPATTLYTQSGETGPGRYIYSIFHSIMSFVALYLSFKCNKGFHFGSFLMACCCPYIYIIYVLATQGTCGALDK